MAKSETISSQPSVTVLIPVFNCERFLSDCLESILNQTYNNFGIVAVNDGSTDDSGKILDHYASNRSNIRVIHQPNLGIVKTLNRLLVNLESDYVMRMDGDDISLPNRIRDQVDFMESNKSIGIAGTGIISKSENLDSVISKSDFPTTHNLILWRMLYSTAIGHATIILRTKILPKLPDYNDEHLFVEDYGFLIQASEITKLANLSQHHYIYRIHENSTSRINMIQQQKNHFELSREFLKKLNITSMNDDCVNFLKYNRISKSSDPNNILQFLLDLYVKFIAKYKIIGKDQKLIKRETAQKLLILARSCYRRDLVTAIRVFVKATWFEPRVIFRLGLVRNS